MLLFEKLAAFVSTLSPETISNERKEVLNPLVEYIQSRVIKKETIRLNFICTHNSRRSHFSQIWAQTMTYHFNVQNVVCYSGGTESTVLFPKVVETLINSGFQISQISYESNPIYSIKYAENEHPIIGFSKTFDDEFNPTNTFAAVMTCSQADEGCPFIAGAEKRIPITFDDPKLFDNTPQQNEKYMERNIQIATELLYVFSQIQS